MESRPKKTPATPIAPEGKDALTLLAVQDAIRSIRYGVVQVIIQDGKIIQIDKTEKIRLV